MLCSLPDDNEPPADYLPQGGPGCGDGSPVGHPHFGGGPRGGLRQGDPPIVDEAEADTDAVAVHAVAVVSRAVEFE